MYHSNVSSPLSTFDRVSHAINDSRYGRGVAVLTILLALGAIGWLIVPTGNDAAGPAVGADPTTGGLDSLNSTAAPFGDQTSVPAAEPNGPDNGAGLDGDDVTGGIGGTDGVSGSDQPGPSNPTPDDPPQPDPAPSKPSNHPPAISDLTVEATGMTVVVRYRVDDPDGDQIATSVVFGDGPTTTTDLPDLPEQGPVSTGSGRPSGGDPTLPGLPSHFDVYDVVDGKLVATDSGGTGDHGPEPTADGFLEARRTYDRDQVGLAHTAGIVIVAEDSEGASATEVATIDLEAIDQYTISDINYRITNRRCFAGRPARRLFGNLDLRGAIHSTNALDEELRADRSDVTLLTEATVQSPAATGLTVSFQPAIESVELTNHVEKHLDSATVQAAIGSGDCAGILTYQVTVEQL